MQRGVRNKKWLTGLLPSVIGTIQKYQENGSNLEKGYDTERIKIVDTKKVKHCSPRNFVKNIIVLL